MKRFALIGILAALVVVGMAGCDWETGDDATSWSSAFNWVNFSGTYRPLSGGVLVSDYSTVNTPEIVANEYQGSFIAGQQSFSGTLKNGFVVSNSLVLSFINYKGVEILTVADNGNGELGIAHTELTPVLNDEGTQIGTEVLDYIESLGSVQYVSGAWVVNLSEPIPAKGTVRATYSYVTIPSAAVNQPNPAVGVVSGVSGASVHTFVVKHSGQHLSLTDNNGAVYKGKIGQMRTASGVERDDEVDSFMPQEGDTLIATIECSGTSAALMQVKIIGTLQGTVASDVFTGRTLTGTWIEAAGKTGDINGQTTSIPIVSGSSGGDSNSVSQVMISP